jgi:hypothetical protein
VTGQLDDQLGLDEWAAIARRNSRSVQTLIGWIFWDPEAVKRYGELGLPGGLGYIASRAAPFSGAGAEAVNAAFGSISPMAIGIVFAQLGEASNFLPYWRARNEAVIQGLKSFAPGTTELLSEWRIDLWNAVAQLPTVGRPNFASHLSYDRVDDGGLDGWHAVNAIREWRGDTHWAIVASHGLSGSEASILHNSWLGYDANWLSLSRGNSPESIAAAWSSLERKGLASAGTVTAQGLLLRQQIEDETDALGAEIWRTLGYDRSEAFGREFEPPCELLLERVNITAGILYQPASRIRESSNKAQFLKST